MPNYPAYSTTVKLLALSRFGRVSPRMLDGLLREFRDIDTLLQADRAAFAHVEGLSRAGIGQVMSVRDRLDEAGAYAESLKSRDISITSRFDDRYPHQLMDLNDPPLLLFCRGTLLDSGRKTVTLAGADEATAEGIELTSRLAKLFCDAGVQVVAALGGGIAAAAHLAARSAGSPSYAVIESGFDLLADKEEIALAIDIAVSGGVISEYSPDTPRLTDAVAQSNRILVGLSHAVVCTELYDSSARAQDMLEFCNQTGKLTFFFVNPELGALADEKSMQKAVENGAIPMTGYSTVPDIIRSLV